MCPGSVAPGPLFVNRSQKKAVWGPECTGQFVSAEGNLRSRVCHILQLTTGVSFCVGRCPAVPGLAGHSVLRATVAHVEGSMQSSECKGSYWNSANAAEQRSYTHIDSEMCLQEQLVRNPARASLKMGRYLTAASARRPLGVPPWALSSQKADCWRAIQEGRAGHVNFQMTHTQETHPQLHHCGLCLEASLNAIGLVLGVESPHAPTTNGPHGQIPN